MSVFNGLTKLEKTYQYLLIALGFLIPVTVAGANISLVLIVLIWLFSGNYKQKWQQIISNKLAVAAMIFFALHLVGLLWTEDMDVGLYTLKGVWYYLLALPAIMSVVKKQYIRYYIGAFIVAMTLSELLSYLVWFELIPEFKRATIYDPSPFMNHTAYNPLLALAIYLVSHEVLFNSKITKYSRIFYGLFSTTMAINMFITGGRAGQVAFFVLITILIFQYFYPNKIKSILVSIIIIPSIFIIAYTASPIFNERFNLTIQNLEVYDNNKHTNVGARIIFAENSLEIIASNLLFGVGTGDVPVEYSRVHNKNSPNAPNIVGPHNTYILVSLQFGVVGLIVMFTMFYYQFKLALQAHSKFIKDVGIALPVLFLVIMFSESYLTMHYTKLLFVFFSAFLYKDYAKN